jgi:serine/threonine-protein kinase
MYGHEEAWRVPGYTEVRELGTGGSGRVVLARREGDDAPVAIKYLSDELRSDLGFVARFRHEARLLSILRSPHAAAFYEYIESPVGAAIVMELVDGVSLRTLLRSEGPTGPEAALVVLQGSLLGLAAAHSAGVVHRDFKPDNVMVDADGNSKLVDFGIAVRSGDQSGGSGTPAYMAPEQWSGMSASPSTDVYAATIVFFECLTGTRPFRAENIAALARQHQTMEPPIEEVPGPLRGLIERGMAKHPADRPVSADAFLAELEAAASEGYGKDWEERGRRRLSSLAGLLLLLFPLSDGTPESGTSLAETHLHGPGGFKKLGLKIVVGLGAVAAVTGATAIVVNTLNGTELRAQTTTTSPTAAPETILAEPDAGPSDVPTDTPEASPSPEATSPTPAATEAATPPPVPYPTKATAKPPKSPKPSVKPTIKPTKKPTKKPTATPTGSDPEFTGTAVPKPPAGPPKPTPTPTPTPTRTPPTPTPTPTTSTPTDGGVPRITASGTPSSPGTVVLAVGLVTTGGVPVTLALGRGVGRHRRRR